MTGLNDVGALGDRPSVYAPLITAVTTDADGRFTLHGVGAERVTELYIDGLANRASSLIVVATRPLDSPVTIPFASPGVKNAIWNALEDLVILGANLQTTLAPGRIVEGLITDRDSASPVPGAKIIGPVFTTLEYPGFDRFFATTDERGYYRIEGLPIGRQGRWIIDAPKELPYFGRQLNARVEPGIGVQQQNVALAKGIWITAKVVDELGNGLRQSVEYHVFNDNPYLQKDLAAGFSPSFGPADTSEYSQNDGSFRIRGYPGRGIVTAGGGSEFLEANGVDQIKGLKKEEIFETLYGAGGFSPYLRSTTIEVNIPETVETFDCELKLIKGKSRFVQVVGPDGLPLDQIQASGLANQIQNPIRQIQGSDFEVTNLIPGEKREVVARSADRKLTGMAIVTEGDGPVTLRLAPWAAVKGRLIDDQGQPRSLGLVIELEDGKLPIHTFNGRDYDKEEFTIDADGRFELIGLVPGATYRLDVVENGLLRHGSVTRDFTLKPGENRDFGDVKILESTID